MEWKPDQKKAATRLILCGGLAAALYAAAVKLPALEEYRRAARELLPERVTYWRERMGVTAGRVSIRAARTRWGSCSGAGNLSLSLYLMMADPEAVDYVVIHELAHRRQMNHSPAFWAVVEEYCPHWRACRERLRALARQLERQNWWGEQEESPSRQP